MRKNCKSTNAWLFIRRKSQGILALDTMKWKPNVTSYAMYGTWLTTHYQVRWTILWITIKRKSKYTQRVSNYIWSSHKISIGWAVRLDAITYFIPSVTNLTHEHVLLGNVEWKYDGKQIGSNNIIGMLENCIAEHKSFSSGSIKQIFLYKNDFRKEVINFHIVSWVY